MLCLFLFLADFFEIHSALLCKRRLSAIFCRKSLGAFEKSEQRTAASIQSWFGYINDLVHHLLSTASRFIFAAFKFCLACIRGAWLWICVLHARFIINDKHQWHSRNLKKVFRYQNLYPLDDRWFTDHIKRNGLTNGLKWHTQDM